jgi:hypothetical protein
VSVPVTGDTWLAAGIVAVVMVIRFIVMRDKSDEPIHQFWCQRCESLVPVADSDDCCPICKLVL